MAVVKRSLGAFFIAAQAQPGLATVSTPMAPQYYSNKRWCCGDKYHFDMSAWAFERLADTKVRDSCVLGWTAA